jgi:phosphatidate cytidylyltransferase
MLRWRLILGAVLIAAIGFLVWLDNVSSPTGIWLFGLGVIVTVLASGEIVHLMRSGGLNPQAWLIYLGNLALIAAAWLPVTLGWAFPDGAWNLVALCLGLCVVVAFLGEMYRYEKPGGVVANLSVTLLGILYIGWMFSFLILLRLGWGIGPLITLIVVVKMGDIGAYTLGRIFGRHKMAPVLSPGKTYEGLLGAVIFSTFGAWLSFSWLIPSLEGSAAYGWLPFGIVLGLGGLFGDLAESLIKRDTGCKDSSSWMPGFGGVLDILDSILWTAPIAYLFWQLGWSGFVKLD